MKNLYIIFFAFMSGFSGFGCDNDEPEGETIAARILNPSCGGTAMQLIEAPFNGESWKYYANLKGPFDPSNPPAIYENCILVGNVPLDRRVVGDTLYFTYTKGLTPGNYCDIGGLPKQSISVQTIKSKL